ncbi:hypothetical protein GCM10009678_70420 [Actinomadura kijaniata]
MLTFPSPHDQLMHLPCPRWTFLAPTWGAWADADAGAGAWAAAGAVSVASAVADAAAITLILVLDIIEPLSGVQRGAHPW